MKLCSCGQPSHVVYGSFCENCWADRAARCYHGSPCSRYVARRLEEPATPRSGHNEPWERTREQHAAQDRAIKEKEDRNLALLAARRSARKAAEKASREAAALERKRKEQALQRSVWSLNTAEAMAEMMQSSQEEKQ